MPVPSRILPSASVVSLSQLDTIDGRPPPLVRVSIVGALPAFFAPCRPALEGVLAEEQTVGAGWGKAGFSLFSVEFSFFGFIIRRG